MVAPIHMLGYPFQAAHAFLLFICVDSGHASSRGGLCRQHIAPQAGGQLYASAFDSRHQTCSCMPLSGQLAHPWYGLPCLHWCASAPCLFVCACLCPTLAKTCRKINPLSTGCNCCLGSAWHHSWGHCTALDEALLCLVDAADETPFTVPVQLQTPAMDDGELGYALQTADASTGLRKLPSITGMLAATCHARSTYDVPCVAAALAILLKAVLHCCPGWQADAELI